MELREKWVYFTMWTSNA